MTKPLPVLHETDQVVAVWLQATASQHGEEETPGLGRMRDVVVQLDKGGIKSIKAFPHWDKVPEQESTLFGCGAEPGKRTMPATPSDLKP